MDILKRIFALDKQSPAQTIDSAMFRFALGMMLVAIAYATGAAMYFASGEITTALKDVKHYAGLLVFPVVLPPFIRLVIMKIKLRGCKNEPEGFMIDVVHKAAEMSFSLTFIALIAMQVITEKFYPDVPAGVAIKIMVAITLGLYCAFFFYFHQAPDGLDDDEFDEEQDS